MSLQFRLFAGVMWSAETRLPFWEAFGSEGVVEVTLGSSALEPAPPDAEYHALIDKVLDAEPKVSGAVLKAVWAAYPTLRDEFEDMYGEPPGDLMPALSHAEGLQDLIALEEMHIHGVEAGGAPYTGYTFSCTWEEEHGLGVLMHGDRLVEVGDAATACTLWMAARHARDNGLTVTGPMSALAKD